jgi:DNA replication and repair protein RecF
MITDLRLQHFRSYKDASFELSPGVNIIVGPNASGKTNLLEALLVLGRGNSYRAKDVEIVQFNKPWARLDAHIDDNVVRTLKINTEPKINKTYEIEGKTYKRLGHSHSLPVVLFEPNHLQLLAGSPERRREYLDDLLEQTIAGYGTTRRHYKRALTQRNALLKRASGQEHIFPWDVRLSQLAGQIVRARGQMVVQLDSELSPLYKQLSGTKTKLAAEYASQWSPNAYESNLLKKLESSLELDKARGFTGSGPHREDLVVLFDGHPAQEAASRGEVRTAVLAFKILELRIVEAAREQTPFLLLDDVFSELDGKRRHALTDYLTRYQTFITTTDADVVLKHFTAKSNVIALDPKL